MVNRIHFNNVGPVGHNWMEENVMTNEIIQKLRKVKTIPELDALRLEVVKAMRHKKETFYPIQKEFIKAKNRLVRIPLAKRDW